MGIMKKQYRIAPDVKEQILKRIKDEGVPVAQAAKDHGISEAAMESDEELVERFIVQLREIAVSYPGKIVLVTTHGGCIRTFLMRTDGANYGIWSKSSFPNAGYVKALSDGVDFFIKEVAA